MKIIIATPEPTDKGWTIKNIRTASDSCLLRTGDPLFIPDHLGKWQGQVMAAVRISRLGTNIPLKFAGRYFDAMTLALVLRAADKDSLPEGMLSIVDRSIAPGEWISADALTDEEMSFPATFGDTQVVVSHTQGLRSVFEAAVHALSRYCTFKTGDIVIIDGAPEQQLPLEPDTRVKGQLDGREILNIKLK